MSQAVTPAARLDVGLPTHFLRACASAWIGMRRPAFLAPSLAALGVFGAMMVAGIFLSAARPGGSRITGDPLYLSDLARPEALSLLVGGTVSIVGSCVLAIAAAHVAGAFGSGTIRVQLVRQPRRVVWLLAHLTVLAALTVALTVAAVLAVVVSAFVAAAVYDVPTGLWQTGESWRALAVATADLSGSMVGFAMLGATLAVALRSAIATIGVGLCYALFEQLIAGVFPASARFLPTANLSAWATHGGDDVGYAWGVTASCVLIAIVVTLAAALLRRRDVLD